MQCRVGLYVGYYLSVNRFDVNEFDRIATDIKRAFISKTHLLLTS
jgi:hypothetical protein